MKNLLRLSIAFIAFSILVTSCKNKSNVGGMIPSDATFVTYFNTKSLLSKYSYDEFKSEQLFKDIMADSTLPVWAKNIFNDPKESGIDMDKGIAFFFDIQKEFSMNIVIEGSLTNAGNFEKFNQHLDSTRNTADQKGIKYLVLHNQAVVAWNNDNFVYVYNGSENPGGLNNLGGEGSDSLQLPSLPNTDITRAQNYAIHLFSLKSDSSLAKDSRFTGLIAKNGDIKFWTNTESIMNISPSMSMLSMLKLDALIKGNRNTYNVSFEKGKITGEMESYYGKEMMDLFKKYKGDKIKTEDLARIPSKDVLGAMTTNFNPQLMMEIIKMMGLDGVINMYGSQIGITLDDLIGGINGHTLFAFSDLKQNSTAEASGVPDFNFLFSMGIKDQAKFKKIVDAINKMAGMTNPSEVNYNSNDKMFALSNHKEFTDSYLAGKENNTADWMDKLSGNVAGFYLNLNKIFSTPNLSSDSITNAMLQKSAAVWDNIFVTGSDIGNNSLTGNATVNLMDKNTNSLKVFSLYADQLYQLGKLQKERGGLSSSVLLPPLSNGSDSALDNVIPPPEKK